MEWVAVHHDHHDSLDGRDPHALMVLVALYVWAVRLVHHSHHYDHDLTMALMTSLMMVWMQRMVSPRMMHMVMQSSQWRDSHHGYRHAMLVMQLVM